MKKINNLVKTLMVALSLVGFTALTLPGQSALAAKCGGVETSVIKCDANQTGDKAIFAVIAMVIRIMTAGIGILAVGAVIFGAVLYATSGNNPENVKRAKNIWINTVIGLMLFAFLYTITNFLIPGGVF